MDVTAINPATGQTVKVYRETAAPEVTAAIEKAHEAWKSWRDTSFSERAVLMRKTCPTHGVRHPDLNVKNILLAPGRDGLEAWLLDEPGQHQPASRARAEDPRERDEHRRPQQRTR